MFFKKRKGIAPLLAGALYVGIVSIAVLIVVQTSGPAITKMQDIAAVDQAKDSLTNFDKIIQDVAAEGKGSTRVVPVQIKKGNLEVSSSDDNVEYRIDTKAEITSARTRREIGNLIFKSNANVKVTDNGTDLIMENEHLVATFNKTGNSTDFGTLNISTALRSLYLKDTSTAFNGVIRVRIDGLASNEIGNGYVYAENVGSGLARGRIIMHVNNTAADYDVYFTLESGRDHIFIEIPLTFNSHV